jgi:hypothetical protein
MEGWSTRSTDTFPRYSDLRCRFDPVRVLEKLRRKRLLFVGDSLLLGQWLSFVCLVNSVVPYTARSMERSSTLNVYKATEYNASIEFYWAPFLVESNSDRNIRLGADGRVLHVDAIEAHARRWKGADILVFDSYVWWMTGRRIKTVWGGFSDDGYEELDAWVAFRLGLKTWANWVDAHIDPGATRVLFMSVSTTHMRSEDWGGRGVRCYNETRPVLRRVVLGQRLRPPDDAGDGRRAGPDAAGARRAAQHHAAHGAPRRRARLRLHRGRRRAAHRRAARRPGEVYGLHPLVRARRARHVEPDTLRAPVLVAP